jgi:hypothetical protein
MLRDAFAQTGDVVLATFQRLLVEEVLDAVALEAAR